MNPIFTYKRISSSTCRQIFLEGIFNLFAQNKEDLQNKTFCINVSYTYSGSFTPYRQKLITDFCKNHGYLSPDFVFLSGDGKNVKLTLDICLLNKGFVIHYLLGLLSFKKTERELYAKHTKMFDNDPSILSPTIGYHVTTCNVLSKTSSKYWGFRPSSKNIPFLKKICGLP